MLNNLVRSLHILLWFDVAVMARSRNMKLQALSMENLIESESFVCSVEANFALIEIWPFVFFFNPIIPFSFVLVHVSA